MKGPSYFTCTLSQALAYNREHCNVQLRQIKPGLVVEHDEFQNIPEFVTYLADHFGQNLAVGCIGLNKAPRSESEQTTEELLTFKDVDEQTERLSQLFRAELGFGLHENQCVALIASSSIIFLLTWLALIRSGYEVLLVSPQNSHEAIWHLIKSSNAFAICHDSKYENVVDQSLQNEKSNGHLSEQKAEGANFEIKRYKLPWQSFHVLRETDLKSSKDVFQRKRPTPETTAFYRHSSGTTGLPKLIPQTHHGAVNVIPRLQKDGRQTVMSSTFSTTPLYSGAIADLWRSWSAAAPLWIFPEGQGPIIGQTVSQSIQRIDEISQSSQSLPQTKLDYLSCVPFVLEAIIETKELKDRITRMAAVGVGGAAMPPELGDRLVADGINLVSRFGSSECGFLLSSERNYETDHDWHVLRLQESHGLEFKQMDDGRHELVVKEDWPLVSTATHATRPFNTHDVFTPNDKRANAWNYGGRSDAQLTLSTGKKFDPSPIEQDLRRSKHIGDVVVVGDDRAYPAAIIFEAQDGPKLSNENSTSIAELLRDVNHSNPPHSRLERSRVCILPSSEIGRIRKNNKGGIIRSAFVNDFKEEIASIYSSAQDDHDDDNEQPFQQLSMEQISEKIAHIVQQSNIDGEKIGEDDDFFEAGVDSSSAIQIRKEVCRLLPKPHRRHIPLNIVYECGSIRSLTRFVHSTYSSENTGANADETRSKKHKDMQDMVKHYAALQPSLLEQAKTRVKPVERKVPAGKLAVVLTGATGFLGTHILKNLLQDDSVTKVFLCVRGSRLADFDEQQRRARNRIEAAIRYHKIDRDLLQHSYEKLQCIPFLLTEPDLGLTSDVYSALVTETTHIIHAAWEVNFNLPLKTFSSQVQGTVNLLNLAILASKTQSPERASVSFVFCSSTASTSRVSKENNHELQHTISTNPSDAANLGYAQSKWVTENLLAQLKSQASAVDINILRVGQLGGDQGSGIWNPREAWPLMIYAGLRCFSETSPDSLGADENKVFMLPELASTSLSPVDWLPVNQAAAQVVRHSQSVDSESKPGLRVSPVSNADSANHISWATMQKWTKEWASQQNVVTEFIDPGRWLDELEASPEETQAKALIPLWRSNWVSRMRTAEEHLNAEIQTTDVGVHETAAAKTNSLDQTYIWSVLDWVSSL